MITGKLNLAALQHVSMEVNGKNGKIKGIFLPIEVNKLFVGKNGALYLDIVAFENKTEFSTHIIKQSFNKKTREAMSEDERKALPILGNLKCESERSEAVSDAGDGKVFEQNSEMPW